MTLKEIKKIESDLKNEMSYFLNKDWDFSHYKLVHDRLKLLKQLLKLKFESPKISSK